MKHGYKNPLVTYEEIVEAIKAIIECSLNNNYMDDFDYLNLKYESESSVNYEGAEERALYKAVKSLEKTIESANKIIKDNLAQNLKELELSRFTIHVDYLIGQERRKLAASQSLIEKLANASINLNTIFNATYEEEKVDVIEPIKAPKVENVVEDLLDTEEDDNDDLELDLDLDLSINKANDTTKEYNDFEKKVLIDFPEFFKEELEIAKRYSDDDYEPPMELDELFNTMELEPIAMDYVSCESIENSDDDSDIILADDIVDTKRDDFNLDFVMPTFEKEVEVKKEKIIETDDDLSMSLDSLSSMKTIKEEKKEEILPDQEEVKEEVKVEPEKKKINKDKILLLKKALDKAKGMHDEKLISAIKKQLAKELGVEK